MTAAILLAAGESTRMGQPKALLPWGGDTLIEYQIRELTAADVSHVIVVLGHQTDDIRTRVPPSTGSGWNLRTIVNQNYQDGRATSLRAGAATLPGGADPILVLNVDQPRPKELLRRLVEAHVASDALISRPVFGNRHGHPIVLSGSLLDELRSVDEKTQGLLGVVNAHRDEMQDVDLVDERVLVGFNTPEEYEEALTKFG
jgi:molybdenum cofactor cytidylyltransferase